MNIKQRLKKLEAKLGRRAPTEPPAPELTDEEEADQMAAHLWMATDWGKDSVDPINRAWYEAAQAARQQGHTEYHIGLRPEALAFWLKSRPQIQQRRRTVRVWVWDEPPVRRDTMTMEEFKRLPTEEKYNVLREDRRGHYSQETRRV